MLVDNLTLLTVAARALVLFNHANTFYKYEAELWHCLYYLAGLTFVYTGDYHYSVAFFNVESIHTFIRLQAHEK